MALGVECLQCLLAVGFVHIIKKGIIREAMRVRRARMCRVMNATATHVMYSSDRVRNEGMKVLKKGAI